MTKITLNMLTSWKFWSIVLILIIVVMYAILGGNRDIEIIGIKPLQKAIGDGKGGLSYDTSFESSISSSKTEILEDRPKTPDFTRYSSRGEEFSCKSLGLITGKEILNGYRKAGIINPSTGRQLEIDCYLPLSDGESIGIEYNGKQHYVYPNSFHKTKQDFINQVMRDKYKIREAVKKGIYLINIPYTIDTCVMTSTGPKTKKFTLKERYTRIYDYIEYVLTCRNNGTIVGKHYTTHYMG
jgi:hypothetical protein